MHMSVQILVLGAGWTSNFVETLCDADTISYATTSRSGRDSTVKFIFDPDSDALDPYTVLPSARTVIITFPITTQGASERLIRLYCQTHGQDDGDAASKTRFVQLGTTSIWDVRTFSFDYLLGLIKNFQGKRFTDGPSTSAHIWYDRHSLFTSTPRAEAEKELLALSPSFPTTVLNLSGLWGGTRSPKTWVDKVAPSKEALRSKVCIPSVPYFLISSRKQFSREAFTSSTAWTLRVRFWQCITTLIKLEDSAGF